MNEDILLGKRIKQLRKVKKLTQRALADAIHRSPSMIYKIERGEAELSPLISRAICEKFRVMKEWLLFGDGPMFWPEEQQTEDREAVTKVSEAATMYRALYRIFSEGDKTKIGMVKALVDALDPGEKKGEG